jgi:hypothetical protein
VGYYEAVAIAYFTASEFSQNCYDPAEGQFIVALPVSSG